MNIELKHYDTLERRLKKTTGEKLNEREYARMTSLLAAFDRYEEHDNNQSVLVFGRPGNTTTLVPKAMDQLLLNLGRLPGGAKELARALDELDVLKVLTRPPEKARCTLIDGLFGVSQYGRCLYTALMEHYQFHWYFHPDEINAAAREGRVLQQGLHEDVFHAGAFELCRAVGAAQSSGVQARRGSSASRAKEAGVRAST